MLTKFIRLSLLSISLSVSFALSAAPIEGARALFRGDSTFFEGAQQYLVQYCADAACATVVDSSNLALEEKLSAAPHVFASAIYQLKRHLYGQVGGGTIHETAALLTIDQAMELVNSGDGRLIQPWERNSELYRKFSNFLRRNVANVQMQLVAYDIRAVGDGEVDVLFLYNAQTGWVTIFTMGTYAE